MRDMERIKPKYNLTLDNKQIVMLIVSSVIIIGLVFIIGFVIGKNTGLKESNLASTGSQLTKPQNAVVFTQQTLQNVEQNTNQASQPSETTEAMVVEQTMGKKTTQTTTAEKHTELTFYKSLTEGTTHKEVSKKRSKNNMGKKNEHPVKGTFSIQCGAFSEKAQAERLSKELKEKYKQGSWIEATTEQGRKLYRVKIGHFETKPKAQTYEKQYLEPKGLRNCIISINK